MSVCTRCRLPITPGEATQVSPFSTHLHEGVCIERLREKADWDALLLKAYERRLGPLIRKLEALERRLDLEPYGG